MTEFSAVGSRPEAVRGPAVGPIRAVVGSPRPHQLSVALGGVSACRAVAADGRCRRGDRRPATGLQHVAEGSVHAGVRGPELLTDWQNGHGPATVQWVSRSTLALGFFHLPSRTASPIRAWSRPTVHQSLLPVDGIPIQAHGRGQRGRQRRRPCQICFAFRVSWPRLLS